MKTFALLVLVPFALIACFILLGAIVGPQDDPANDARVNQTLLNDCLRADRERIFLYGEAKPTPDCLMREAAYALAASTR